jgi:hypothetical protein
VPQIVIHVLFISCGYPHQLLPRTLTNYAETNFHRVFVSVQDISDLISGTGFFIAVYTTVMNVAVVVPSYPCCQNVCHNYPSHRDVQHQTSNITGWCVRLRSMFRNGLTCCYLIIRYERSGWSGTRCSSDQCRRIGRNRGVKLFPENSPSAGQGQSVASPLYNTAQYRLQIKAIKDSLQDKNAPFGVDLLLPQIGGNARKTNVSTPDHISTYL